MATVGALLEIAPVLQGQSDILPVEDNPRMGANQRELQLQFLEHRAELLIYLKHRLGDAQLAEEIVQDMYLRYCQTPRLETIQNTRAYLFGMARHMLVDAMRQNQRQRTEQVSDEVLDAFPSPEPSLEEALHARQMLEKLAVLLDRQPELTRQIFTLNRLYQYTHQEVADQLGISVSTVQKHLAKALAQIAAQMREH